jgi:hypothetical protein
LVWEEVRVTTTTTTNIEIGHSLVEVRPAGDDNSEEELRFERNQKVTGGLGVSVPYSTAASKEASSRLSSVGIMIMTVPTSGEGSKEDRRCTFHLVFEALIAAVARRA